MTSLHLSSILAAVTTHREITTMPKDDAFVFVQAVNEALLEWARIAPEWMKKGVPLGFSLQGPQSITLGCTAGSQTVTISTSFPLGLFASSAQIVGCTLITGSSRFRLTSPNTLDFPWDGATGSQIFTIYGDTVQIDGSLSLIKRVVMLENGRETQLHAITGDEAAFQNETFKSGRPVYFNLVAGNTIGNSAANTLLTVYPAPETGYKLRVERHSLPELFEYADLITTADLPITDQHLIAGFIPLAKQYIAESTVARSTLNLQVIETAAERVRQTLPFTQNPSFQPGRVMTQPGF